MMVNFIIFRVNLHVYLQNLLIHNANSLYLYVLLLGNRCVYGNDTLL